MTQSELLKHFYVKDGVIFYRSNNKPVTGSLNKGYKWLKNSFLPKQIGYHRALWILVHGDIDDDLVVDHINRNTVDNRLENLRAISRSQNAMNAKGKSGAKYAKNVYKDYSYKKITKYRAQVTFDGKRVHVGGYDSPEEAEEMAKALRKFLHGEFAIKESDL